MKKIRKRGASKISSSAATGDDEDADGESKETADGDGGGGGGASLQTIRLMQKLRSKGANVLSLGEGTLALAAEAAAASDAAASSSSAAASVAPDLTAAAPSIIGKEFGMAASAAGGAAGGDKDAQAVLIDQQMEQYIAEQMAARRALRAPQKPAQSPEAAAAAAASASAKPSVNLSEDQLFDLPVSLAVSSASSGFSLVAESEESGERWLTGIAEVPLSIRDKMRHIERTEEAKAAMMRDAAAAAAKRADLGQEAMILPANYNSNFRLHKKEWDGRRREEFRAFNDAQNRAQALAAGLPLPLPSAQRDFGGGGGGGAAIPAASDPRALPGFLAVTEAPRGPYIPRGGGAGQGQPGQPGFRPGVPNATDDRVVDRFIKRFKYK
jgi:hypothetical protein